MNLHEHLRDLVAQRGPSVVESAEAFRGALDDFLTEDEATTGELNLLVDAVRLGAVHRLLAMVDQGADPAAAVNESGDAFARDRGTDDLARCRWAVAVIGHGLGRIDETVVRATAAVLLTRSVPTPPPPPPTAPPTVPPPRTFPETTGLGSVPAPPPAPPPSSLGVPGVPPAWTPAPPPKQGRRGRTVLVAVLVGLLVAGAVAVGVWLGSRDDPEQAADDPGGDTASEGDPTGGDDADSGSGSEGPAPAIPTNSIVVPLTDENGDSRIYAVDADSGQADPLTDGPDDRLPAVSLDRSTLIYVERTPGGSGRPIVLDMTNGKERRLFGPTGACEYAARPGIHPAGNRLAVVCLDEFGGYLYPTVVNLFGAGKGSVPVDGPPLGSPTWTSEGNTMVFAQESYTDGEPSTLVEAEVNGSTPVQLTDGSEGFDSHPDWSKEAGLLLFSRHEGDTVFGDLLTMDAEGQPGPATSGELWGHPAWSPDGTRVVFTERDSDGTERLAVASVEGDGFSDPEYLTDLPGEPGVPAWGSR